MPQMGESIFEGTITKWLKQPGEKVQRDEPLFEISTDKVDAEIPAPASGTLQDIKVQAGSYRQVNTVVGTIAEEGDCCQRRQPRRSRRCSRRLRRAQPAAPLQAQAAQPPSAKSGTERSRRSGRRREGRPGAPASKVQVDREGGEQDRVRSSPLVRDRQGEQRRPDARFPAQDSAGASPRKTSKRSSPSMARRSSSSGAAPAAPAAAAPPAPRRCGSGASACRRSTAPLQPVGGVTPGEVVPMSVMRKKIAEHMVMSKRTSAHVHGIFEVDVTRIVKTAREHEGQVRAGDRQQADLHAVLRARRGARHSQVAHHQLVGGRRQHPLPRRRSISASPSRWIGD